MNARIDPPVSTGADEFDLALTTDSHVNPAAGALALGDALTPRLQR